jgi:hypothetical protein
MNEVTEKAENIYEQVPSSKRNATGGVPRFAFQEITGIVNK